MRVQARKSAAGYPARALLILLLGFSGSPMAASAPGDTAVLPAARARAAGGPATVPGVQALSVEVLARHQNLADALKAVPGFRVRTQSGLGGYAETWFRGSDGRQLSVYLDGMPLNSSLDPAVDLGKIPVLSIRGMEVDKGGFGSQAGPEGGLAAIRLSTFPLGSAPVSVTGRLSSFGGQEAALAAKAGSGNAAFHLDAGVDGARNDHPFPTDNGTLYVGSDDFGDRMRNNAYAARRLGLAWRRSGSGGRLLAVGARWDDHRKEYPGLYTGGSKAYTAGEDLHLHADWRDTLPLGPLRGFSLGALGRATSDGFRDPGKTLGFRTFSLDREGRLLSASAALLADLPRKARLRLGARAGWEESRSEETEEFREWQPPDAARSFLEPSAALEAPLFKEDGIGALRARAEAVWTREALETRDRVGLASSRSEVPLERTDWARTLRAGMAWTPEAHAAGPRFAGFLAEWESVERFPVFHEILGDNNGVQKNLGLRPQATYGASLEASAAWGSVRVTGGPFWQHGRDPIRLGPLGASNFLRFGNGVAWRSYGLEARLDASGARWRLGNALTAARPAVLAGSAAGNLPAWHSRIENLADLSVSPLPSLWLDADLEFRSAYHPDDLNLPGTRRPPESVAGAGVRWRRKRLEASLRADNLGDSHYRDFAYSPKSGRRYAFRLSMNP